jgi:hypothetical protein
MTKILTASMLALILATASMAIPTEVFAKGGKHYSGGKHHGHHGKHRKHRKDIEVDSNDDDDDDNDCKIVRKASGKIVRVCNTEDDDD